MSKLAITKRITNEGGRHRLRIWVTETSNNIPAEVFVYQHLPFVPDSIALEDVFVHIASYADISDYPATAPDSQSPFFRIYSVDLIFTSLAVLNQKWAIIRAQIQLLVEDIVRLNNLPPAEVEVTSLTI